MKLRTFHNRIERQEYAFSRAEVEKALKVAVAPYHGAKPQGAVDEKWTLDWETDGDGHLLEITLRQQFEYPTSSDT